MHPSGEVKRDNSNRGRLKLISPRTVKNKPIPHTMRAPNSKEKDEQQCALGTAIVCQSAELVKLEDTAGLGPAGLAMPVRVRHSAPPNCPERLRQARQACFVWRWVVGQHQTFSPGGRLECRESSPHQIPTGVPPKTHWEVLGIWPPVLPCGAGLEFPPQSPAGGGFPSNGQSGKTLGIPDRRGARWHSSMGRAVAL